MNDATVGREIAKAVQHYFGIIRAPHDDATTAFLAECQPGSVSANGKRYAYYRHGQGPAVLLVHGYNSNLGSMIAIARDVAAAGRQAVLFDAPAHGEAAGTQVTHLEAGEQIRKIGEQLGEIQAVICHSLGAVWALCAWRGEFRARALIAIGAPSDYRFLVGKFAGLHKLGAEVQEGLARQLERRFGDSLWDDCSPAGIVQRIDVPGLVIHGADDDFVPPVHAERLAADWPRARAEIVEGVGHFDAPESPKVRAIIARYLRERV